jgi:hypothetical protein
VFQKFDEAVTTATSLIFVDLTGTARNQAAVVAATSLLTFWRRLRGGTSTLIVCAPSGNPRDISWPAGVTVLYPLDLLANAELQRAHEWTFAAAEAHLVFADDEVVIGPHKIQLAGLRRLHLQSGLRFYALAAASLEVAIAGRRAAEVTIVSGTRALAAALCADLRNRRIPARAIVVDPGRWLRWRGGRAATAKPGTRPTRRAAITGTLRSTTRKALLVSETLPMALMFESIEAELATSGDVEQVRVQYGGSRREYSPPPGCRVFNVGAPGGDGDAPGLERPASAYPAHWTSPRTVTMAGYFDGGKVPSPVEDALAGSPGAPREELVPHLEAVAAWMDALSPDLVVVGNDRWWVGQAFVLIAQARGIRTLCVQDGVASAVPEWFWISADHIAVSGPFLGALLTARGTPADRCHMVGQPRYDEFARPTASREELRRAFGLAHDGFCVLFATQPTQHPRYVTDVVTAILGVPSVRLLLRPHPSLPSSATPRVKNSDRERIVVVAEPPIADLLEACDLLVTQHSTVAIEAVLRNRAVITADFTGMPPVVNYAAVGLSTHATTKEELRELIAAHAGRQSPGPHRRLGPDALQALEAFVGPCDGGAARRAAQLIRRLLVDEAV